MPNDPIFDPEIIPARWFDPLTESWFDEDFPGPAEAESEPESPATSARLSTPPNWKPSRSPRSSVTSRFADSQAPVNRKIFGVLVNTWAQVPPLCTFPVRERDSELAALGDPTQETFSLAQGPRKLVSAKERIDLIHSGTQITGLGPTQPDSWVVTEHERAVDNNEDRSIVKLRNKNIALMRMWHGAFCVPYDVEGGEETGGIVISADVGLDRRHVIAYINGDGNVQFTVEDHRLTELFTNDLGFAADWVHVKIDRRSHPQRIRLYTEESGNVKVRTSVDGGETFGAATTLVAGLKPTAEIGLNGIEYVYWLDGTDIKGSRYDRTGTALEAAFVVESGVDDDGIAATCLPKASGENRLVLRYAVSGVLTTKTSQDGIVFV